MCGITGILNFNHRSIDYAQIKAMTDSIYHRGPDGEGHFLHDGIGLGHRRLAIIDLSDAAHQPMQTKDGRFVLTYNGEIYNFREMRIKLQHLGYQFYSHSDTEVILNAYAEWGKECLHHFNGMFAFAIWDGLKKELFIARDRYGIKPLYYFHNDKHFIFGSEIKAILASQKYQPLLNKEGLIEYLTFQNFFTNQTLFQGIEMLMPGHYALIRDTGLFEVHQYWDCNFSGDLKISEQEAIEEIDRLFTQAVKRQLVSDVPINSYLSGGIDSGAIAMAASKLLPNLKTFTIGFDLSSASGLELSFDERAQAEHISYLAKTEHYEMVLKAGDMERCMNKYIYHLEEPRVGQSYPNYYAAKLASKFGKVVLSGCGGDEFFGGYPWRYFYSQNSIEFDDFIDAYYLQWQRLIPNALLKDLVSPIHESNHFSTRGIFAGVFKKSKKDKLSPNECLNYSLYLEAKTFLHGLLVVEDKLSMAHGLETRVPFLDNDLVDFAMKIPFSMKVIDHSEQVDENNLLSKIKAHKNGKDILRKTLSSYLDERITKNKKQGFSSPDASWFRGESIDYIRNELADMPSMFNKKIVNQLFNEHASGSKNHRLLIWSLLYLKNVFQVFNYE